MAQKPKHRPVIGDQTFRKAHIIRGITGLKVSEVFEKAINKLYEEVKNEAPGT